MHVRTYVYAYMYIHMYTIFMYAACIFYYSVTKAKEVTINPPLKKKMGKDSCKFTDKSDRVQTTILQPNPANNTTRIQPKVKHVAIQTQCKLIKNSSSQTENVTFKNKRSQTNQVEFKGTSTQTEGAEKDNLKDTSLQRSKFKDTSSHADAATAKIERYIIAMCIIIRIH